MRNGCGANLTVMVMKEIKDYEPRKLSIPRLPSAPAKPSIKEEGFQGAVFGQEEVTLKVRSVVPTSLGFGNEPESGHAGVGEEGFRHGLALQQKMKTFPANVCVRRLLGPDTNISNLMEMSKFILLKRAKYAPVK